MMELMRTLLVKSPGGKKDSPPVLESFRIPSPVVFDTKVPDSVKLSVHFDKDYSPVKPV